MKRRQFITLIGGAVAWPLAVRAQQPAERMRRIGILADERWPPIDSLKQGLRNLGYIEGQNLEVVYRFAAGQAERYPGLAAELWHCRSSCSSPWERPRLSPPNEQPRPFQSWCKRATLSPPVSSTIWLIQEATSPGSPGRPPTRKGNDWSCSRSCFRSCRA